MVVVITTAAEHVSCIAGQHDAIGGSSFNLEKIPFACIIMTFKNEK